MPANGCVVKVHTNVLWEKTISIYKNCYDVVK